MVDRLLGGAGAVALGVATAYLVPAATWLSPLRWSVTPALAGRGAPGHVALTFDDGPHPEGTARILDALDRLAVRATFFVLGRCVPGRTRLLRRMVDDGHEVALHGLDHRPPLYPWRDRTDMATAVGIVTAATGRRPRWYRPPYGVLTLPRLRAARRWGLRPVLWTAWGRDWRAGATVASILRSLDRGLVGGATVLLHDSDVAASVGSWRTTVSAVPAVVGRCRDRGLAVGPLREHGVG